MEAIILAGGLGTRLREAVPTLPKCLAPVNGRPFLHYLITSLQQQGVTKFIFALGYKAEVIENYLKTRLTPSEYRVSTEAQPLGTGGAIAQAMQFTVEKWVLVTNGDTLYSAALIPLFEKIKTGGFSCCLCLKPMTDFSRYGTVELRPDGTVAAFREKKYCSAGLINGGLYVIHREKFLQATHTLEKFSFEAHFLTLEAPKGMLCGVVDDGYFIDIGIPEDYDRASRELHPENN